MEVGNNFRFLLFDILKIIRNKVPVNLSYIIPKCSFEVFWILPQDGVSYLESFVIVSKFLLMSIGKLSRWSLYPKLFMPFHQPHKSCFLFFLKKGIFVCVLDLRRWGTI